MRGIVAGIPIAGNTLRGMATGFAIELRRWRTARRWSQLELALRAGTTQRHLSFIEQGRSRPGRTMVVRLAESLELSLRERNALLLAAGYAPPFTESGFDDEELRPIRRALDGILEGHMPSPAVVVRPYGEVVAANPALDVLTEGAAPELLEPPVNVLRLALHPRGMAPRVRNLPEWGRHIVDSLRAQAARSPDPRLDEFVAELERYLPPAAPGPDHLGFAVPLRLHCEEGELRLLTTLMSFATAVELHLEAFLPADDLTSLILRDRARRRPSRRGVTLDEVRAFALGLPRTTEAVVRGRLKFRVGRIVYVAFSHDETVMGFGFPKEERQMLVESEPEKFLLPKASDLRYSWVCVRLSEIDEMEMRELVLDAWRMVVPKRVAAAYDERP
jgi:transcriptional regulator with XRE-family HTH domain